jgi:hypothetical protein
MPESSILLDEYAVRARVAPTLVVTVIPLSGFLCWFPAFSSTQLTLAVALSTVVIAIFAQIGRDRGRTIQAKLFQLWGGQPTVQLLRHRSRLLTRETRQRYSLCLESVAPALRLPSEIEEVVDPEGTDSRYDSVSLYLRDSTRNKEKFPLVFAENVNYGFRRNLLGMRPAGIALSLIGAASALTATIVGMKVDSFELPPVPTVSAVLNVVMLTWWLLRINSDWVRVAAFAYAERLIGSCDEIAGIMSSSKCATVVVSKE